MKTNIILKNYESYIKRNVKGIETFSFSDCFNDIERFEKECFKLHDDVNQTYDGNPYSLHLRMVSDYVCHVLIEADINGLFGDSGLDYAEKTQMFFLCYFSSLLHDSIEDARLTYNDVKKMCNTLQIKGITNGDNKSLPINDFMIADIVYAVTNEKGKNRKERANDKYYEGIRNNMCAVIVKICDRLANMKYSYLMGSRMMSVYENELNSFIDSVIPEECPKFKDSVKYMFNELKCLKRIHE